MEFYYRHKYVEKLLSYKDVHYIKVLTGIRRSGKSTILIQYKNKLIAEHGISEEQIIEYNFNNPFFSRYNYLKLYSEIVNRAVKNRINYVFLDEIQDVKSWEKCVIGLFEHKELKFDIYLTGSNSRMLSSELSTLLTGRAKQIKVFPLTFKEFVEASKNTKNIYESFHDYAEIGGLGLIIPDINNIERAKENLLDVLQDTIRKDIENKHHSTKNISIEKTIKYVLNNIGKPISSHKTVQHTNVNSESKINHVSFARYLKWGTDAMILQRVDYIDKKTNSILDTSGKYYAGDIGILNSMTNFKDSTLGAKLENIVLLELLSQGWEVYTLKVYQKNTDNKEIDFVIKNKQVIKYIQVTHTLNNANKHREIDNLLQFKNAYEKICIFLNNESDNENDGVRRVDLIRWLLGDEKI